MTQDLIIKTESGPRFLRGVLNFIPLAFINSETCEVQKKKLFDFKNVTYLSFRSFNCEECTEERKTSNKPKSYKTVTIKHEININVSKYLWFLVQPNFIKINLKTKEVTAIRRT